MAWGAWWLLAHSELRRTWRPVVALGLLAGLCGAVVVGAVGLAVRTQTAPSRLRQAVNLEDARVVAVGDAAVGGRIAALPSVRSSWVASSVVAQVNGPAVSYVQVLSGPPPPADLFRPVVVQGRAPTGQDEVMVAEDDPAGLALHLGSALSLDLLTPAQVARFDTGFGEPDGPHVTLHVTGTFRYPASPGVANLVASPAFHQAYSSFSVGPTVLVRLEPGASFAAGVERVDPSAHVTFPRRTVDQGVRTTRDVLVAGLVVFALVAAASGAVITGMALGRHATGGAQAQRIEAALGLTAGERLLARGLPALLGAGVAGLEAGGIGLLAAVLEPMGALRRIEPDPGWAPDPRVILLGAAGTAGLFLALALATSWLAGRPARAASGPARARASGAGTRRPWLLAGRSLARDQGDAGRAVRISVVAAALGVSGVVLCSVFATNLHALTTSPQLYGWQADLSVADAKPSDVAAAVADTRTRDVDVVQQSRAVVAGASVVALSYRSVKGRLPWTVLSGRLPRNRSEVALGPAVARRLDAGGEALVGSRRLRVVGTVLVPVDGPEALGESVLLTPDGLQAVQATPPFTGLLLRAQPGQAAALRAELGARLETTSARPPPEVGNLTALGQLPTLLALFLAALSAVALWHTCVLTGRQRHHDVAVLRALGFSPRELDAAVVLAALLRAGAALLIGVPLGLGLSRLVWHQVAAATPVVPTLAVPTALVAVVPGTLLVAALLGLATGRPLRHGAAVRVE